jgi:hypothetical protein
MPPYPVIAGSGRRPGRGRAAAKLSVMRSARLAVVLDVCCVLIFVIIGRASHTKGESLAGIASTSWPFLAGLGIGWLAARGWRRPLAIRPEGLAIWLCTVALGMILRVVSGQGTAVAFIAVALAFLALVLLGWRMLTRLAPLAKRTQPARRLGGRENGGRQAASGPGRAARVEAARHGGDLG